MAAQVEYELVKPGKYEFYISGVIDTKKGGEPLVSSKGNTYKRLRLTIIDKNDYCSDVYEAVFGSDTVKEIFECVGKPISPSAEITLDSLHELRGQRGYCMIGIQKSKEEKYADQNNIKCYIPKSVWSDARRNEDIKPRSPMLNTQVKDNQDNLEPEDEDIPF
jgi:hypothetical protein